VLHTVRPSVRPVPPIFSKYESHRNFLFSGKIKVTRNEQVTIVFHVHRTHGTHRSLMNTLAAYKLNR